MSRYGWIPTRRRALLAIAATALVGLASTSAGMAQSPPADPATADEIGSILMDPTTNAPDTSVHYVGRAGDPDVYVAVVDAGDGTVSIYLCDGADIALWLTGTLSDGAIEAQARDGSTASATLEGDTVTGSVTLADETTIGIEAARAALPAGLYVRTALVDGEPTIARTIALPDGTARGKATRLQCTNYEIEWVTMMDIWRTHPDEGTRRIAGNKARLAYVAARDAGCDMSAF
jgi:hypothetical protein